MKFCQVHAVRESRAMAKSDCRRSSPTLSPEPWGRGEETSPVFGEEPGKPVPLRRTSRKNWVSNWVYYLVLDLGTCKG